MKRRVVFLLLVLLGSCAASSITACSSSANVLGNQRVSLGAALQVPSGYPCLDFSGSTNSVLDGSNFAISATSSGYSSGFAIKIANAVNLTIMNVNFASSYISVSSSSSITITQCTFSGVSSGTTPGFTSTGVTGLTLVNNTFTGNATLYSTTSTNINVRYNTFTSVSVAAGKQILHLKSAYHFTIYQNTFTNNFATYGIFVECTSTSTDSGGDVSGNSILGGYYQFPISLSLYGTVGFTVTNNWLSDLRGICDINGFIGIAATSVSGTPSVTISDNTLENFNTPCIQFAFWAIYVDATTSVLNNNFINNVTMGNGEIDITEYSVVSINEAGSITNLTISNIVLNDQAKMGNGIQGIAYLIEPHPTDLSISAKVLTIDGLYMTNFTVLDTAACATGDTNCASAPGNYVYGFYSGATINGQNIYMDNFKAGSAGTVNKIKSGSETGGGSAYAVVGTPDDPVFSFSNVNLKNFKGGNGGGLKPSGTCTSRNTPGDVAYFSNWTVTYDPTKSDVLPIFAQLSISAFSDGADNCYAGPDSPTNVVVTPDRTSFTMTWPAVAGSGVSYSLDLWTGSTWTNKYAGTTLSSTVSALTDSTTYHVRLAAKQSSYTSPYATFLVNTLSYTPPSKPTEPTSTKITNNSISLSWTEGSDNGGYTVTNFTLEMLDASVWTVKYTGITPAHEVIGLNPSTTYQFRVMDANAVGSSDFSDIASITTSAATPTNPPTPAPTSPPTPAPTKSPTSAPTSPPTPAPTTAPARCGDGLCNQGLETCSTCFSDCGACTYPSCPGTPQCLGGTCSNGVCGCPSGKSGSDCGLNTTQVSVSGNSSSPSTVITIPNQQQPGNKTQFSIGFRDIEEIDIDGNTRTYFDLTQFQFTSRAGNHTPAYNETIFSLTLPNEANITVYLYVAVQDFSLSFANQTISVAANSVKYSMEISSWPFAKQTNHLKMTMNLAENSRPIFINSCIDTQPLSDGNLLWLQVRLDNAVLYTKFSPNAELDGKPRGVQYAYNYISSEIEISIPFFWDQAAFDPDFQVMLDDGHYTSCSTVTVPAPPKVPTYKEFSAKSITVNWTAGNDGGLPITNFTLQILNVSTWHTVYTGNLKAYKVVGLSASTMYQFRVADSNALGQSNFSLPANISTASKMCGDGTCDPDESCSSCFLDCGSCGYPSCPGTPECNGGTCVNGTCACPTGQRGSACEYTDSPIVVYVNSSSPSSVISIRDQEHTKDLTQFAISFQDIHEVDSYGNPVQQYDLTALSFSSTPGDITFAYNQTIFNTTLPNHAVITVYLYVVTRDFYFTFSNQTTSIPANSVKYSMTISNWPFQLYNNKLKVTIISKQTSDQDPKSGCVDTQTDEDSNNLLWMQVRLNGAVIYGTFSSDAEIDGESKRVQYSFDVSTSSISISIPFFWDHAEFDPDFQFLVDFGPADSCSSNSKKTSSLTSGKIAGMAVGMVIGAVLITASIVGYVYYKKRPRLNKRRLQYERSMSNFGSTSSLPSSPSSTSLEPISGRGRRIVGAPTN